MSIRVAWPEYYKITDRWPATKTYRNQLYSMLSKEQVESYKAFGMFKEGIYTVAYGGHYNVWTSSYHFCITVDNREPAVEQILVAEILLLRTTGTLRGASPQRTGQPSGTPFVFAPDKTITSNYPRVSGQVMFPDQIGPGLIIWLGTESYDMWDKLLAKYPAPEPQLNLNLEPLKNKPE